MCLLVQSWIQDGNGGHVDACPEFNTLMDGRKSTSDDCL